MNRSTSRSILSLACIALAYGSHAFAATPAPCSTLDSATTAKVAEYVAAKYHMPSITQLSLKSASQANADCYWKFQYEVLSSRRVITLYLTPDRKYLVPAIYDRNSDPLAEERVAREESLRALTAGHAASEGPKNSPVTLVEFSDFQCPYCSRLTTMLEKDVLPDNPDVRVVFRNFPLAMHPWAQPAAQIAACAQMQNDAAFWKLHDYIFSNQKEITAANVTDKLLAVADAQPGLKHDAFHECVDQSLTMGPVAKDVELGKRFDVHATPTVFINGVKIEGVRDSAQLKQLIAQARLGQLEAPAQEATQRAAVACAPGTAAPSAVRTVPAN